MTRIHSVLAAITLVFFAMGQSFAQDPMPSEEDLIDAFPAQVNYSPYPGRNFPTRFKRLPPGSSSMR